MQMSEARRFQQLKGQAPVLPEAARRCRSTEPGAGPGPHRADVDCDFAAQPGVDEQLIRGLATLRFLDDASNVLFVGPPGVGKTMLSVALGRARSRSVGPPSRLATASTSPPPPSPHWAPVPGPAPTGARRPHGPVRSTASDRERRTDIAATN
ncbi:ATP-binding protein [Streptomyces lavendulae]|uniref:ATP-binding protein n=1 Tax=Streptomyces lavendulae TaxID=1914 RepID=UPI0036EC100F